MSIDSIPTEEIAQRRGIAMAWAPRAYFNLVKKHKVWLRGWPPEYPFGNLSKLPQSTGVVRDLQRLWDCGELRWELVPEGEILSLRSVMPSWTVTELDERNPGRRDIGGTHYRPVNRARHPRSGAKTPAFVTPAMDPDVTDSADEEPEPARKKQCLGHM